MAHRLPGFDDLLRVIDLVYATALEPAKLEAMLRALSDFLGSALLLVDVRDAETSRLLKSDAHARTPDLVAAHEEYVARWSDFDPRAELRSAHSAGAQAHGDQHARDDVVAANAFYQEFLLRHGLRWSIGGTYDNEDGTVTMVTAGRAAQDGPFGDHVATTLRELLGHFKRAGLLASRLQSQAPSPLSSTHLFNLLPVPLLLTDCAGRCIETNEAFEEAARALSLRLVLGRLRLTQAEQQLAWERALAETLGTAVERSVLLAGSGRQWRVRLLPLAAQMPGSDHQTRLILAVFEEKPAATPQVANFPANARFTRAELEVLAGMMQGLSAKAIAKQRGASVNTVRTQIMSILEKSGHNSQRELIAAFSASAFQDSKSDDSSSPYD